MPHIRTRDFPDGGSVLTWFTPEQARLRYMQLTEAEALSPDQRQELDELRLWYDSEQRAGHDRHVGVDTTRTRARRPDRVPAWQPASDQDRARLRAQFERQDGGSTEQISNRAAGYGAPQGETPAREWPAGMVGEQMHDHPRQEVYRARKLLDNMVSRDAIPADGAEKLSVLLGADDVMARWRAGRMVNVLGSDEYAEAFIEALRGSFRNGQILISGPQRDLLAEGRALALGAGATGGFAVPFQLDPAVLLTSSGTVDPVRRIARVETGHAKELDLVTSAGVTAAYATEGLEASDNSPTLAQPKLIPSRMQCFVPFSIELDVTWSAIMSQLVGLLTDAADVLDAQAHITGNGTAPVPQGIITGMTGQANAIQTISTASLVLADLQALQRQVPPRFRSKSRFVANLATIQLAQGFQVVTGQSAVQGSAQSVGNMSETGGPPLTLLGDPLHEASFMSATPAVSGSQVAVAGSFRDGYCIYDVVPSLIEPIPMLFGTARGYPTGQRGLYLWRFGAAQVIVPQALAMLTVR